MTTEVTLNTSASGAQSSVFTASVTVNGTPVDGVDFNFTIEDITTATVEKLGNNKCKVTGVYNPDTTGTRDAVLNSTCVINGQTAGAQNTVHVVTVADTIVVTGDFEPPTP